MITFNDHLAIEMHNAILAHDHVHQKCWNWPISATKTSCMSTALNVTARILKKDHHIVPSATHQFINHIVFHSNHHNSLNPAARNPRIQNPAYAPTASQAESQTICFE